MLNANLFSVSCWRGEEPKAGDDRIDFCFQGKGFYHSGEKKKSHPFTKRYPSLPTSESCFWHLGSLCHLRHLIFKWRSFMAELSWQCWQNDWGEHAVLLSVLGAFWREGVLHSGDRALLALPWSARLWAVCSFSPPHLKAQKEFVQGDTVLGTSRWSWGCMEPHLFPWVPECEQECHLFIPCHVPGPATELVSVRINCPIHTYLFNQQVSWALWKPQMFMPCICKDICMGLLLYVLKSPGSHFLWTLVFFCILHVGLEISAFYWQRSYLFSCHSSLSCLSLAPEHSWAVAEPHQLKGHLVHIYSGITTHSLFSQQMSEGLYVMHQARPRGKADSFFVTVEPAVWFP